MNWLQELSQDQLRQILATLYQRDSDTVMSVTAEVMAMAAPTWLGVMTTNPDGTTTAATNMAAATHGSSSGQVQQVQVQQAQPQTPSVSVSADGSSSATGTPTVTPTTPSTNTGGGSTRGRPSAVSWDTRFFELTLYKAQKGTCKVSLTTNPSLHRWVASQRKHYRLFMAGDSSQLTQEKIDKLQSIGFEFITERQQQIQNKQQQQRNYSWDEWLDLLQQFKDKHGHTNVPQKNEAGLGLWVAKQRQTFKLWQAGKPSPMTPERVAGLTELGFIFESQAPKTPWKVRFAELQSFKEEQGHTRVQVRGKKHDGENSSYSQLGKWVEHQRTQYKLRSEGKQSAMNAERIDLLEAIGFEWIIPRAPRAPTSTPQKRSSVDGDGDGGDNDDGTEGGGMVTPRRKKSRPGDRSVQTKKWNEKWEELKAYQQQHGHCRVAAGKGKSYSKLGKWVEHQRTQYRLMKEGKSSSMTEERIERLKGVGFEFAVITPSRTSTTTNGTTTTTTATTNAVPATITSPAGAVPETPALTTTTTTTITETPTVKDTPTTEIPVEEDVVNDAVDPLVETKIEESADAAVMDTTEDVSPDENVGDAGLMTGVITEGSEAAV
mmetsp:Transcript_14398/g.22483  ORF Transcript_14398/g.22483 Transcript_14398/m.22483 type:complete len:604 (-) Transcript_14398:90-1901(-)